MDLILGYANGRKYLVQSKTSGVKLVSRNFVSFSYTSSVHLWPRHYWAWTMDKVLLRKSNNISYQPDKSDARLYFRPSMAAKPIKSISIRLPICSTLFRITTSEIMHVLLFYFSAVLVFRLHRQLFLGKGAKRTSASLAACTSRLNFPLKFSCPWAPLLMIIRFRARFDGGIFFIKIALSLPTERTFLPYWLHYKIRTSIMQASW